MRAKERKGKRQPTKQKVTAVYVIAKGYLPELFHQDLDFVEVFHVRHTSNELGAALI